MNRTIDELLVLSAKDGDERAIEMLFRRWHKRLLRHAWQMTQLGDAAVELVQETWLGIIAGIGRLEDPARFPQWAHRIVANKCASWIRRQQRERKFNTTLQMDSQNVSRAHRHQRHNDAEFNMLRKALKDLPAGHRTVLSMFYLDGMSVREIAHALRIPAGTVKSRLFYARQQLRTLIGE